MFFKEAECMCVSSSVRDTNAPTTGRGRLLPLDYHFFLHTVECCSHGNKKTALEQEFIVYLSLEYEH